MGTRREFLVSCTAIACAGRGVSEALGGELSATVAPSDPDDLSNVEFPVMDSLSRDNFAAQLNTVFRAGPVDLTLVEVREGDPSAQFEQFSLLFRGPRTPALSQGTYGFEHAAMGRSAMFIVPMGEDREARYYEAVFSRARPQA